MTQDDPKRVPTGRLHRLAHLAGTGLKTGAGLLLRRDAGAAAEQAALVLGRLRGVAAKVGQMASYVDGMSPEYGGEAFRQAMAQLRSAAPASPMAEIQQVVLEELGAPVDQLFASFSASPVASASIGQVHRATLPDGTDVAVKVQHPGVAAALEADLRNTALLEGIANVAGGRRVNAGGMFEEIRQRLREELDYALEAKRQSAFAAVHQDDAQIEIPRVVPEYSRARVLTTTWMDGLDFEAAVASSLEQRERWARTLWRFVFRGNLVSGMFNADPHPGNYLFQPNGSVAFLDFGCVQTIVPAKRTVARTMHRAASQGDEDAFRWAAALYAGTVPGRYQDMAVAFMRQCFEPLFQRPWRMTRPYCADLVATLARMAQDSRTLPDAEVTPMPEGLVFMNRMNFGFYSVLARLDVDVDYAAEEAPFLDARHDAEPVEGALRPGGS